MQPDTQNSSTIQTFHILTRLTQLQQQVNNEILVAINWKQSLKNIIQNDIQQLRVSLQQIQQDIQTKMTVLFDQFSRIFSQVIKIYSEKLSEISCSLVGLKQNNDQLISQNQILRKTVQKISNKLELDEKFKSLSSRVFLNSMQEMCLGSQINQFKSKLFKADNYKSKNNVISKETIKKKSAQTSLIYQKLIKQLKIYKKQSHTKNKLSTSINNKSTDRYKVNEKQKEQYTDRKIQKLRKTLLGKRRNPSDLAIR